MLRRWKAGGRGGRKPQNVSWVGHLWAQSPVPPELWRGVRILDRMGVRQGTEGGRESAWSPLLHPSTRCLTAPMLEVYSWRNGQRPGLRDTKAWARSRYEPENNQWTSVKGGMNPSPTRLQFYPRFEARGLLFVKTSQLWRTDPQRPPHGTIWRF